MRPADTSRDAYVRQLEVYRAMTPARRIEIALSMSEEATAIAIAGIRARHRDYDDEQTRWALLRLRHGDRTFVEVWPEAPLLAP